jgi:microcystin-dependent protein
MERRFILVVFSLVALLAVSATAQTPFLGEIDLVAFNFAPHGWALCNGQILPIAQNQALFALLGTTYGGNGTTTFALPDLRGRRAISSDGTHPLGQLAGEESVTLVLNQIPSHSHTFIANSAPGNALGPGSHYWASASQVNLYSTSAALTALSPLAIGFAGGNQPHDNMSPYLVLNYIIALQGIFPSQN